MSERRSRTVRRLTASAMLAALGFVILWLGALIEVLDITMAALASILVVFAVIELGGKYPYLIYGVTSVLSVLLLPVKTPALLYVLFLGYYPIIKAILEKHLKKSLAWLIKIAIFLAGLALAVFLALRFFTVNADSLFARQYWVLLISTPIFILYDVALTRLIGAYLSHLHKHFRFLQR